ncbi:hypothetical protein [Collinsella vaginalis]|uniref:hypothetical protein n=1 Tax=Collinsella vaginalis TaxID=1870987 RepID=UPI000A271E2F|nr:hypothetical protein [Collinsella vaginalis]
MSISSVERKRALADAAIEEVRSLESRGVVISGNGFSPILLVKGVLNESERGGGPLLVGADGVALRAALAAIGWEPEDFCGLSCVSDEGDGTAAHPGEGLSPKLFREAVEALDPEAVVLLDAAAADLMREAYADDLAMVEDFNAAMLQPGIVIPVLGRRVLALSGFEAGLDDPHEKQVSWAYLKQLPPLGSPV